MLQCLPRITYTVITSYLLSFIAALGVRTSYPQADLPLIAEGVLHTRITISPSATPNAPPFKQLSRWHACAALGAVRP